MQNDIMQKKLNPRPLEHNESKGHDNGLPCSCKLQPNHAGEQRQPSAWSAWRRFSRSPPSRMFGVYTRERWNRPFDRDNEQRKDVRVNQQLGPLLPLHVSVRKRSFVSSGDRPEAKLGRVILRARTLSRHHIADAGYSQSCFERDLVRGCVLCARDRDEARTFMAGATDRHARSTQCSPIDSGRTWWHQPFRRLACRAVSPAAPSEAAQGRRKRGNKQR